MSELQAFLHQSQVCDLSTLTANTALNERQQAFLAELREYPPVEAARRAGYESTSAHLYLLKLPQVLEAVAEQVHRDMQSEAPTNLRVLKKIRDTETVSPKVRADIGFRMLALAGHIIPRTKDDGPQKALSEMTQGELIAFIDANQAAIDRAADELMAKAKDVTPASGVTVNVPKQGVTPAKATDYLD